MGTARFTRASRLLKPAEYKRVFSAGKSSKDSCFVVLGTNNGLSHPRLGMAISKRHVKRAVDRNRVKRLIREAFRQNQEAVPGLDLVVLGRQGVDKKRNSEICDSLDEHWKSIKQRCVKS